MCRSSIGSLVSSHRRCTLGAKRIDNEEKYHSKTCCTFTLTSLLEFKTIVAFCSFGGLLLLGYNIMVSSTTIGMPSIKAHHVANNNNENTFISSNNRGSGTTSRNSRISALMAKLSFTNDKNYQKDNSAEVSTTSEKKGVVEWVYPLNMTAVLDEAQIPPPHSPWHVLPSEWQTTTNSSSVSDLRRSMQHDIRRYIEEDGLSLKSRNVTFQRLYLIRNGTLWKLANQTLISPGRWLPVEEMMQSALDIGSYILKSKRSLLSDHYYKLLRWLLGIDEGEVVTLSNSTTKMSFPLLVNKEDFKGCTETQRIPQFTYAMESSFSTDANRKSLGNCIPFALPMYDMWGVLKQDRKFTPKDWYSNKRVDFLPEDHGSSTYFDLINEAFPWDSKTSKVLWRGSTTGGWSQKVDSFRDVPRFQLVLLGLNFLNFSNITDFGFVKLNQGWEEEPFKSEILSEFGPLKPRMKFNDFMTYKAVLDTDGNSWSSRFGHLLCLNSVILKVESNDFVNYFEYPGGTDGSPELLPWHHYIPVMKNLSNLVEVSSYVLDPRNEEEMLAIVKNANQWCQHKMAVTQFAIDVLWMILNYVDLLYFHNPKQQPQQQNGHRDFTTPENHQSNEHVSQHVLDEEAHVDETIAKIFDDHQNPLNFHWMEQFVYQSHEWRRAMGNNKGFFEAKV